MSDPVTINPGPCPLALGTVQLGLPYGIANRTGMPTGAEACAIVQAAWDGGIRVFDTAQAYGESETVLGQAIQTLATPAEVRVVTKLHPDSVQWDDRAIEQAIQASLTRLGLRTLWGLLLHREESLALWDTRLRRTLMDSVRHGRVGRLGVSVYSVDKALAALHLPDMRLIQVPGNLFDRRFIRQQVLRQAAAANVTVFVRSVYLQGLALLPPEQVPVRVPFGNQAVQALDAFCRKHNLDRKAFAFAYARNRFATATLVVGADTTAQVVENLHLSDSSPCAPELFDAWDATWPDDIPELINPSLWK